MPPPPDLAGIVELGGHIVYKANVKRILTEDTSAGSDSASTSSSSVAGTSAAVPRATGVKLADGRVFR